MQQYPRELKLEAIRLFYEEGKSRAEITILLQIRSPGRVKQWLHLYREKGEAAFDRKLTGSLRGRPPKKENQEAYIARLEMENALLKKFHAELRKLELAKRNIGSSNDTEEPIP